MAKNGFYRSIFITILIALGGWAIFSLAEYGIDSFLRSYGVESQLLIYLTIIISVILVLFILGFGFRDTLKKMVR